MRLPKAETRQERILRRFSQLWLPKSEWKGPFETDAGWLFDRKKPSERERER